MGYLWTDSHGDCHVESHVDFVPECVAHKLGPSMHPVGHNVLSHDSDHQCEWGSMLHFSVGLSTVKFCLKMDESMSNGEYDPHPYRLHFFIHFSDRAWCPLIAVSLTQQNKYFLKNKNKNKIVHVDVYVCLFFLSF